ncbi:ankyrin repeat domain-containing protein [Candidatus Hydrogenedentota bacterium]
MGILGNLMDSLFPARAACRKACDAAKEGDLEKVRAIAERSPESFLRTGSKGGTPAHWAAHAGHADCVKIIEEATRK